MYKEDLQSENMQRGFVFSFDALIAMFVLLIMVFLMLAQVKLIVEKEINWAKEFELKSKGIFYLDSLIKNLDKNSSKGVAFFNEEKKRVESNVLNYNLLKKIDVNNLEFVKRIELMFENGTKEIIVNKIDNEEKESEACLMFERFVLVEGKKANLRVKVCDQ